MNNNSKNLATDISYLIASKLEPHISAIAHMFNGKSDVTIILSCKDQKGCAIFSSNNKLAELNQDILIKKIQENKEMSDQMVPMHN